MHQHRPQTNPVSWISNDPESMVDVRLSFGGDVISKRRRTQSTDDTFLRGEGRARSRDIGDTSVSSAAVLKWRELRRTPEQKLCHAMDVRPDWFWELRTLRSAFTEVNIAARQTARVVTPRKALDYHNLLSWWSGHPLRGQVKNLYSTLYAVDACFEKNTIFFVRNIISGNCLFISTCYAWIYLLCKLRYFILNCFIS